MSASRPFKMTISLDVLRHLGIGLYSNIPAVLSELVATLGMRTPLRLTSSLMPRRPPSRFATTATG